MNARTTPSRVVVLCIAAISALAGILVGPSGRAYAVSLPVTSNLLLWFDGTDLNGDNVADGLGWGTPVTTWVSKDPSHWTATQANAGNQPMVRDLNGAQVVMFAGDDYLSLASGPTGHRTLFVVYQDMSTAQWVTPLGTSYNNYGSYHGHSGDSQLFNTTYTDPATVSGTAYANGVPINGLTTSRPGSWTINTYVAASALPQTITVVGSDNIGAYPIRGINGGIAEIVLYSAALSDNDINLVGTYLANRYSLTWSALPVTYISQASGDWSAAVTWTPSGGPPRAVDSALVHGGNQVVYDAAAVSGVNHLTVTGAGSRLTVAQFLAVNGSVSVSAGGVVEVTEFLSTPALNLDGGGQFAGTAGSAVIVTGNVTYGTASGTAGSTISGNLSLGGMARTFAVANSPATADDLKISGPISNGGVIKTGPGTLVLGAEEIASPLTTLTVNFGVVRQDAANALGDFASTAVTVNCTTAGSTAAYNLRNVNQSIYGLTFGGAGATATSSNAVDTGTGTLTVGDGNVTYFGTNNPPGAAISGKLALVGAMPMFTVFTVNDRTSAAVDLTVSAAISGSGGGLAKHGGGAMTLSGANTYTGPTSVSGGRLQFARKVALYNNDPASWTAANLIVGWGATAAFNLGGTGEFTSSDIATLAALGTASGGFTGGSILGLDTSNAPGGTFAYNSVIADPNGGLNSLGLTKLGTGTLTLGGQNTYTGPTTVLDGTLNFGPGATLPSGMVTVDGGTLDIGARSGAVLGITLAGGRIDGTTGVLTSNLPISVMSGTISAVLAGDVGLLKTTGGSVTLAGPSTFTGDVILPAATGGGTLLFNTIADKGQPSSIGAGDAVGGTGDIFINTPTASAGVVRYTGTSASSDRGLYWCINTDRATQAGSGAAGTFEIVNPDVTLGLLGAGVWGSGSGVGKTLRGPATGLSTLNLGAIRLYYTGYPSDGGLWTGTSTLNVKIASLSCDSGGTGASVFTFNGPDNSIGNINFTIAKDLTLNGSGTTNLTGANVFSGLLTVGGGRVVLTGNNSGVTGIFAISAGTLQVGSGGTTGTLPSSPSAVVNNAGLVFNRSDTLTVSAVISGTGTVTQAGTGRINLTGANTYAGATTINAGALQIGNASTTGTLGRGPVTNNGSLIFNRSNAMTVANPISGMGSVTQSGAGTTTLSATNTYEGPTVISRGTLKLDRYNLPMVGRWTFNDGETLVDKTGNFSNVVLQGNASVPGGKLDVNGSGTKPAGWAYATGYKGADISDMTLVSWLTLQDLAVTAGGPIALERIATGSQFHAIDFAERQAGRWAPGSTNFSHTQDLAPGYEETTTGQPIMVAVSYKDNGNGTTTVTMYRNDASIGSYTSNGVWIWTAGTTRVLFGPRSASYPDSPMGAFDALIDESRLYNTALTAAQVADMYAAGPNALPGYFGSLPATTAVQLGGTSGSPTLDLNGTSQEVASLSDNATYKNGKVVNTNATPVTLTLSAASETTTFCGAIVGGSGGAIRLVKSGGGTQVLAGSNTYTGGTLVEGGTLRIAVAGALPTGRALTIGDGGTMVLASGVSATSGAGAAGAAGVPEPGTLALAAAALALAGLARWRRRCQAEGCSELRTRGMAGGSAGIGAWLQEN